jgi:3-oxoacyl-(acyl-carrier-protein) synthase
MLLGSAKKEVVISGVGVVTPLESGKGTDYFWNELCKGTNAVNPIQRFNVQGCKCDVGAEVYDFERFLEDAWGDDCDRVTKLFALASQYALQDAKIGQSLMSSMGIAVGTILGGIESGEKYMNERFLDAPKVAGCFPRQYFLNAIASSIADKLSLLGPTISISTACCSGSDAIRSAASQVRNGRIAMMLAGGTDVLSEFAFRGFSALNALTTDKKVRPFDKRRTGLALGEGSGVVVLEEKAHAQERGAKIYCTLEASGSSADAYHLVRPHGEGIGLSQAISVALSQLKEDTNIDYICAHGTGTSYNDRIETKAIKRAFGEKAYSIKINSIKSMIGHTLGAASAIEAINCIKTIEHNIIPPTINFEESDPECDLDYVVNSPHKQEINACMSLSAGFGGQNCALIFKRVMSKETCKQK